MNKDEFILREMNVDFSTNTGYRGTDHDGFEEESNHFDEWASENMPDSMTRWSIYGMGVRMDKACPYPVNGKEVIYDGHFGDQKPMVVVQGDTWGDLWRSADEAVRLSGDDHHVFIEGFEDLECGVLELITGS